MFKAKKKKKTPDSEELKVMQCKLDLYALIKISLKLVKN